MHSAIGTVFGWKENIISRCVGHGKLFSLNSKYILVFFCVVSFSLARSLFCSQSMPLNNRKPPNGSTSKWNTKSTFQDVKKSIEWNDTRKSPKNIRTKVQKNGKLHMHTSCANINSQPSLINERYQGFNVSLERLFSFFGRFHFHSATRNNKID